MKPLAKLVLVIVGIGVAGDLRGALPAINDGFEGYALGQTFVAPTGGWSSTDAGVMVTNSQVHSGNRAVVLPGNTALTNTVNASGTNVVWTDFWIEPGGGVLPPNAPTSTASFLCYVDTNGYAVVANPSDPSGSGWTTCSNDVWGRSVAPVTMNFAHISVYQNYTSSNEVVFVNDQLVLQSVPLTGGGTYNRFVVHNDNVESNAWLDDVWIQPTYNSATLVADRNGVYGPDALEVQTYGYAARTLYVGGATGFPWFATLTNALAVCRPHDTVYLNDGSFGGTLSITQNVTLTGATLTNVAGISVAAGATLTLNQSANVGTLNVTGTLYLAAGTTMACQSATINGGTVTVAAAATFSNNAALSVIGAGVLQFTATNSQFIATAVGVDAFGVFNIGSTWPGLVAMPLPFAENFENYVAGSPLANLGFAGWGANNTNAWVATGQDHTMAGAGKSACLAAETAISNSVSATAQKVWSDFYVLPTPGVMPVDVSLSAASFAAYVDTNGWLVAATSNGWVTCSNYIDNSSAVLSTATFSRVTVRQDFGNHLFAVFVQGKLLREQLPFPSGAAVGAYHRLDVDHFDGTAYLDDVSISTQLPANMTSDLDGDGIPDALEIDRYGTLTAMPRGSIFSFR